MMSLRSEQIKKIFNEGGLTLAFCLLSVSILPVYIHYLPPLMLLWVLCWLWENKSGLKKDIVTDNKAAALFFLFVIFYLWQIAGLFFSDSLNTGVERLFKRLSFIVFPLVLFYPGSGIIKNIKLITRLFAICTFIYIIYCFGNAIHHSIIIENHRWIFNPHPVDYDYEYFFYSSRFSDPVHPSYLSMYIVLSILISLEALFDSSLKYLKKGFYLLLLITFLLVIYLLSSRAGMLSVIIIMPLYFLYKLFGRFPRWIIFLSFAVMILAFVKIAWTNNRLYYNTDGVTRTQPDEILKNDVRYNIWRSAVEVIKQHLIVGVGTGDATQELKKEFINQGYVEGYYDNLNAHNQFLELLLENGLIGLILFLAILGYILFLAIQQQNILMVLFVIMTIIFFLFETMLNRLNGVSFFSLFSFLLLYYPSQKNIKT
jgi:O-antigen ligase